MEDHALWRRSAKRQTKLSGVRAREETEGGVKITSVEILDEEGERALGKPRGTYVTLECMPAHEPAAFAAQSALLSRHIRALLPVGAHVLVAGLGNDSITPDALGPKAASMVLATRHIRGEFARSAGLSDLRPTAVLSPGVLGQTGVESSEIIRGLCAMVRPAAVIVVDALACRSLSRLGCTVQVCDTGIAPGSGVGNHRQALNADTLGVPVIAIGVPTVVDAATIAMELTGSDNADTVLPQGRGMMVTPREIDLLIDRASRLVAMTINRMLQPEYSPLELIAIAV